MRNRILIAVTVLCAASITAQTPSRPPAAPLDLTVAEVQTMLKAYAGAARAQMKSIDAGKHTVDFWLEQRQGGTEGTGGSLHTEVTEIYIIVEGSGTLLSNGRVLDKRLLSPKDMPGINSPTFHGDFEGGVARKLQAGDIVVNPPGTVHQWKSIDSP